MLLRGQSLQPYRWALPVFLCDVMPSVHDLAREELSRL